MGIVTIVTPAATVVAGMTLPVTVMEKLLMIWMGQQVMGVMLV